MTTPVQMGTPEGEPVMQFVLPKKFNKENTPSSSNGTVKVIESEEGMYLAVSYGGYTMDWRERKAAERLRTIANQHGIELIGAPILMVYNSPYQVFGRKNEVLFKVNLE